MAAKELKQQAIKAAYGEFWEQVKDFVDENGWVIKYRFNPFSENTEIDRRKELNIEGFFEYKTYFNGNEISVRPKSLAGIETNNGWISILSEKDLPKDEKDIEFWILDDGEIIHAQFMHESKSWYDMFNLNLRYFPTHYQPIIKPKPKIF